jgi:hypothetical protein
MKHVDIIQALDDDKLFGPLFRGPTWRAWRVFLKALFALPITDADELELYRQCTNRTDPPTEPSLEATLVIGRRGGKSRALALLACFLACFRDWRPYLAPGEVGYVIIVAVDHKQARAIFHFVKGMLHAVPLLRKLIAHELRESIELKNKIVVEICTASYKTIRSRTVVAALLDEMAFWPIGEEVAEPDTEIVNALRPSMITIPGAMLLCASSPYAQSGVLFENFQRYYGKTSDHLVWKASTKTMHPNISQKFLDREFEKDPVASDAEYNANFRSDVTGFLPRELVMAAVTPGIRQRRCEPGVTYFAFYDAAQGVSKTGDSFTAACVHRDRDGCYIVDWVYEARPIFSVAKVCRDIAALCRPYHVKDIMADNHSFGFAATEFARNRLRATDPCELPKSDLYRECFPLFGAGKIQLIDEPRMLGQWLTLERRVLPGGGERIDHPVGRGHHDDIVNAHCRRGLSHRFQAFRRVGPQHRRHHLGAGQATRLPQAASQRH